MKHLHFFPAIVIIIVFFSSCSTLPLFKKSTKKNRPSITPAAHAASEFSDIEKIFDPVEKFPKNESISQYLRKYTTECIALAALLLVLLFYRLQTAKSQRRKYFKLNDVEMAMLGLAVHSLRDLWDSLQTKTKRKIIPFPSMDS